MKHFLKDFARRKTNIQTIFLKFLSRRVEKECAGYFWKEICLLIRLVSRFMFKKIFIFIYKKKITNFTPPDLTLEHKPSSTRNVKFFQSFDLVDSWLFLRSGKGEKRGQKFFVSKNKKNFFLDFFMKISKPPNPLHILTNNHPIITQTNPTASHFEKIIMPVFSAVKDAA